MLAIGTKVLVIMVVLIILLWIVAGLFTFAAPYVSGGAAAFDSLDVGEEAFTVWDVVADVALLPFGDSLTWPMFSTVFLYVVIAFGVILLGGFVVKLASMGGS